MDADLSSIGPILIDKAITNLLLFKARLILKDIFRELKHSFSCINKTWFTKSRRKGLSG